MSSHKHTILVTGGTTGLGYHCALEIAKQRPNDIIIIASRSNADDAAGKINKTLSQSNVQYLPLDLLSLSNVRDFASTLLAKDVPPLSALVLNAGLQFPGGIEYNSDGFEKTFAVNHIGHALLFYLLQPRLTPTARIVLTSSGTHDPAQKAGLPDAKYITAEELAHPSQKSAKNDGRQRYATSKLCNVLWMYALARHAKAAGKSWTVTAMDPGLMPGTGLARDASPIMKFVWNRFLPRAVPLLKRVMSPNVHTPRDSGSALARLAVGDDVEGISGKYFEGLREIQSSGDSFDEGKQEDLWEWTAKTVARDQAEAMAFKELSN